MTEGWAELDTEPPHRSESDQDVFRDACVACPHRIGDIEFVGTGDLQTYVRCRACSCPLKIVTHRYGNCPVGLITPPDIK